jgi:hypothetical protein
MNNIPVFTLIHGLVLKKFKDYDKSYLQQKEKHQK